MTSLPEACAHACPICNQDARHFSGYFAGILATIDENGVSDATRARSLVKRFHRRARIPLRSPFPEAFFQVPTWRIEQESVVAAMPVLLDSGCISGISFNSAVLNVRMKTKLLLLVGFSFCCVCGGMGEEAAKVQSAADPHHKRGSGSGEGDRRVRSAEARQQGGPLRNVGGRSRDLDDGA